METSYAFVQSANTAVGLYVIDHIFFAFAIAISTYFQKTADKDDIASTASVSFTIKHIAAVLIPALLGLIWITSPTAVFLVGTGFAVLSLLAVLKIPLYPTRDDAVVFGRGFVYPSQAAGALD